MKKLILAATLIFSVTACSTDNMLNETQIEKHVATKNEMARSSEPKVYYRGEELTPAEAEDQTLVSYHVETGEQSSTDRRTAQIECKATVNPGVYAYLVTVSGDGYPPRHFIAIRYKDGPTFVYTNTDISCTDLYQISAGTIN